MTRSAMRAAAALRSPTSPARLATRTASTATGMTMAMNSSAASTSASVKPARARASAARHLEVVRVNFIIQAVAVGCDPYLVLAAFADDDRFGVRFADEAVGREADRQAVRGGRSHCRRRGRRRFRRP